MDRGERPQVSGLEARRIVEFIASLYKSAFTGQPVRRGVAEPVQLATSEVFAADGTYTVTNITLTLANA